MPISSVVPHTHARRALTAFTAACCAAVFSGATGCVANDRYANLEQANQTLTERNQELVNELERARAQAATRTTNSDAQQMVVADLKRTNDELQRRLAAATAQMRDFESRVGELAFGSLDPDTDAALARLAAESGELISYDAAGGFVRFASDLTFASGSDIVSDQAKTGLGRLADVLNSSSGLNYEILIVGHTDNQRIANPNTLKNHPTNVHLSAHRAIAVRSALREMGVPASRMQVAGWGEHRPLVANNPRGGTAENRRVEIYLRQSTDNGMATASVAEPIDDTPAGGANTRAPGAGVEPVK